MRLIIFGPPGSGKGTYSMRLKEKIGVEKISTGDIFRMAIKEGSELGKRVREYVETGKLVPDEIVIPIVEKWVKKFENFILDGYPRTIRQAEALEKMTKIDAIILVRAHREVLIEKISGRRICSNPRCDGNYNVANIHKIVDGVEYILPPLLPKNDMRCDKCGSPLFQREDDKKEVVERRLEVYEKQSKPILEFYRGKVPFVEVWMNRPPEIVVDEILEKLRNLGLSK